MHTNTKETCWRIMQCNECQYSHVPFADDVKSKFRTEILMETIHAKSMPNPWASKTAKSVN